MNDNGKTPKTYEIRSWELNMMWLEGVILSSLGMALAMRGLPALLSQWIALPQFVYDALGFSLPGLVLYPTLSLHVRNSYGRELTPLRHCTLALAAGVLASGLFHLMS